MKKSSIIKQPPTISAEVIFGSPRRKCKGLGICRVDSSPSTAEPFSFGCPSFPARLILISPRRLLLSFATADLGEELLRRQFRGDRLRLTSPFTLSPQLGRLLGGGNIRYRIPVGNYPTELSDGRLTVEFALQRYERRYRYPGIRSKPKVKRIVADI